MTRVPSLSSVCPLPRGRHLLHLLGSTIGGLLSPRDLGLGPSLNIRRNLPRLVQRLAGPSWHLRIGYILVSASAASYNEAGA